MVKNNNKKVCVDCINYNRSFSIGAYCRVAKNRNFMESVGLIKLDKIDHVTGAKQYNLKPKKYSLSDYVYKFEFNRKMNCKYYINREKVVERHNRMLSLCAKIIREIKIIKKEWF